MRTGTKAPSTSSLLLMLGNPGTGKSTLLNALIGQVVFRSGVSFGHGMTLQFELYQQQEEGEGDDCNDKNISSSNNNSTNSSSSCEKKQEAPSVNMVYGDTPGLSDVKNRPTAAAEISKALQQAVVEMNHHHHHQPTEHGNNNDDDSSKQSSSTTVKKRGLKLVFVCTLQAGRVRAEDVTTMKLVLDALCRNAGEQNNNNSNNNIRFGIIVNQLSPGQYRLLRDDNPENQAAIEARQQVMTSLNSAQGIPPTIYIHYYPRLEALEDVQDALHEPMEDLQDFIDMIPANDENLFSKHHQSTLPASSSIVVQADQYQETQQAVHEKLQILNTNPQAVQEEMQSHSSQLRQQLRELQQHQDEELLAQMEELKKEYSRSRDDRRADDDDDNDDDNDDDDDWEHEQLVAMQQQLERDHAVDMTKAEKLCYYAFGVGSVLAGAAALCYGRKQIGSTLVITGAASIANAAAGQK